MNMICNMDCFNCKFDGCVNDATPRQVTLFLYNQSDKGKERSRRYEKSEKGKARAKRRQQKAIASGKNAERCRKYYWRKKGIDIV